MMFSDLISRVSTVLSLSMAGMVITVIVAVVFGAITQKVASNIENHVVFTVCALLLYLFWYATMHDSIPMIQIAMTVSLVVAGREGYKRLVGHFG